MHFWDMICQYFYLFMTLFKGEIQKKTLICAVWLGTANILSSEIASNKDFITLDQYSLLCIHERNIII